jgi:hypothetical protein
VIAGTPLLGAELELDAPGRAPKRIRLAVGETRIPGVDESRRAGEPALATLRLLPDPRIAEEREGLAPRGERDEIEVRVEQLLGDRVVSAFDRSWLLIPCRREFECDEIAQIGNQDGDASVIQLDARRASGSTGCVDDDLLRASSSDNVGNVLTPSGCRSTVAVYSSANAMEMHENVPWTDACGDRHHVTMRPMWKMPVTFYLAVSDAAATAEWGEPVKAVAQEDVKNANQIYDDNKTGISFVADPVSDYRTLNAIDLARLALALPAALPALLQNGLSSGFQCNVTNALKVAGLYVPDRLNVFYLQLPGTGMTCPDDRNVVFMALGKKPATLAHEFGHSLSLLGEWGHTNDVDGFDASNVMWGGDEVRNHISLGQAFRQNLEPVSTLNENQVRQGPTRSCPLKQDTPECPALGDDWARP